MQLFDSHCHLDCNAFRDDFEETLHRAQIAGVDKIMIAGIDLKSSIRALKLAQSSPNVYISVGIHPHDAKTCSEQTLEELLQMAHHPKVKAWGEMGLDFNRMYTPRETQETCFLRQLKLAAPLNLPFIFHERDTKGRFIELLSQYWPNDRRGVVHCFSGNAAELEHYLEMGFYIGVTGILTIKNRGRHLRDLVKKIPPERLLIETDAPFLTPAPQKNHTRRNEPAFVKSVLLKLSEVRAEDEKALAQTIYANTCRFYAIGEEE